MNWKILRKACLTGNQPKDAIIVEVLGFDRVKAHHKVAGREEMFH